MINRILVSIKREFGWRIINWNKFSVIIKKNKIGKLPKILDDIINSQMYEDMLEELLILKDNYFNFESTAEYIYKKIKNS